MTTHVPFTDFALGLASIDKPLTIDQWTSYYKNSFKNVKTEPKNVVDIQFSKCNTTKITFDAPIVISGAGQFSTISFVSTLCSSDELFYLLMHIGDGHEIGSAAISFMKSSNSYISLGGGRFSSKTNNIIVSFEEDELGKYYLLATSRQDLLTIDPLFNFTRQFILE